jgi:transcriptional regulator with XRE-family HTH domain
MDSMSARAHTPTDAELARRATAAMKLRADGNTQTAIAQQLNVSQPSVNRWTKGKRRPGARTFHTLHEAEGDPEQRTQKPQHGRPPILTDDQLRKVFMQRSTDDWTGTALGKPCS